MGPEPLQRLIVVADDHPAVLDLFKLRMGKLGHRCVGVSDKDQLLNALAGELPCLLVLDLHFGASNGLDLLGQLLGEYPGLLVVILTGDGTIENAVAAVKRGAYDFLTKPPDWLRLEMILRHAFERQDQHRQIRSLEESAGLADPRQPLLGDSPPLRRVRALIEAVAPTDAPVLILGETGTGKELVARQLHDRGARPQGPFVAVNMAALPSSLAESTLFGHEKGAFTGADRLRTGCFERADGGTLFLDEIGDLDLGLQGKLLRVLQEHTFERLGSGQSVSVSCRLVAATNRDLGAAIRAGAFREDLYYRLNVVPIQLPPLRERRADVPLLAGRFARRAAARYRKGVVGFTPGALDALAGYDWPGNVRQLENLVERLVILAQPGGVIDLGALPPELTRPAVEPATGVAPVGGRPGVTPAPVGRLDELERQAVLDALQRSGGKVRPAAEVLGLSLATMYRRLKRYGIALRPEAPATPAGACRLSASGSGA